MSIKKGRLRSSGLLATPVQFPAGTVISFAGSTAPEGWMICDGAAISRTNYAGLFAAIGEAWGSGDGSTTFNLPDLRGRFLRGVDNGAGRDPDSAIRTASNTGGNSGDNVGSVQDHAFASHGHTQNVGSSNNNSTGGSTAAATSDIGRDISVNSNGGSETRPINANVQYAIKY
jgi:microcystin-dependent protein